ncbi:MAG: hypothetical protein IPK82_16245 [Polyangiaceae bacterium]|nr:hypothetical protein [Polyangiaceae bacterium]
MGALPFIVFLVFLAVFATYSYWFSEAAKFRRTIRAAQKMAIAQAVEGQLIRVSGTIQPLETVLTAPLSKKPCVFFETTVEEYKSSGKSGKWVEIIRETNACDFFIRDETGRALVNTSNMRVLPVKDHEQTSGTLNDASPELEGFLAKHGHKSTGWIFNKNLRYREGVFSPGERIAVLGFARREQDPDPMAAGSGYRDAPKRIVLEAPPNGELLASDESELV